MTDDLNSPADPQDAAGVPPQGEGAGEAAPGAAAGSGAPGAGAGASGGGGAPGAEPADAAPPEFGELDHQRAEAPGAELSLLYDLTMPVAIELGRTRLTVREILALGRGSVVQLERLAGEPIDVFVGDRRFAEGEVVVVGEQFGVRITRILRPPLAMEQEVQA